jgi:hypothetical protein
MGFKEWGRLLGVLLVCAGVLCLPIGFGVSPRQDLSFFHNLADLNIFFKTGAALVAIGSLVLVASLFLPSAEGD